MKKHDTLCLARHHPESWAPEMCICEVIRTARKEERQALIEDVHQLFRSMPYSDVKTPAAIQWAEAWLREVHEAAD